MCEHSNAICAYSMSNLLVDDNFFEYLAIILCLRFML